MNTDLNFLKHAITSLENNHEFMAHTLKKYRDFEQISELAMLDMLGCSINDYYKLAFCRIPDSGTTDYLMRISTISEYTNIDTEKILRLIKQMNISLTFHQQHGTIYLIPQDAKMRKKNNA